MAYLNANIPVIECCVRGNYLRDQKDSHDKYFEVGVFGFSSIPNRVPMFHFLMEDGGLWWRAPISAFCSKPGVKELPLDELVMWDSFSYNVSVTTFYELAGATMQYISRRKVKRKGKYLFTIDWGHPESNILDTEHSEIPAEHKCAHILVLDDGNYAAQPNNRILWDAPNYTVGDGVPDYSVQTTKWNVENKDWLTEDSNKMFYDVEEK